MVRLAWPDRRTTARGKPASARAALACSRSAGRSDGEHEPGDPGEGEGGVEGQQGGERQQPVGQRDRGQPAEQQQHGDQAPSEMASHGRTSSLGRAGVAPGGTVRSVRAGAVAHPLVQLATAVGERFLIGAGLDPLVSNR
jgi:hypothetical protein